MLGIFGRKSPGELAFQSAQRREKEYEGSGFDPTGLERAAKAAREIDSSKNVRNISISCLATEGLKKGDSCF